MADKIAELNLDLKEFESLQNQATRPKVKDSLSLEIRRLRSDIVRLEEERRSFEAENGINTSPVNNTAQKRYQVKLNNYAWDQTAKYVKFYVTLQKVHAIPAEDVSCTFTNKSLELNVKNLENKDYVLTINKLLYGIKPESSSWKIKTDMVIISVVKESTSNWTHVTELEKRASDAKKKLPETDKNSDPSEGFMSIMRNMYEQGDDEMKRTIAKAWTESQKKGPSF